MIGGLFYKVCLLETEGIKKKWSRKTLKIDYEYNTGSIFCDTLLHRTIKDQERRIRYSMFLYSPL